MLYRLPLELELCILELAAPPLVKPRLHARVDFFIKISLVHRSFTAWAQERLGDQFLYTYRPREDESARLERRLTEAGFGPNRSIRRLYLDVTSLGFLDDPQNCEPDLANLPETGDTVEPRLSADEGAGALASEAQTKSTHNGHSISKVGQIGRTLKLLLSSCMQSLDTLWLMPSYGPNLDLSDNPAPRLLDMDDGAFASLWNHLHGLPLSQRTTLVLRNTRLALSHEDVHCPFPALNLILDRCRVDATADLAEYFPDLEVLIACKATCLNGLQQFDWLPTSVRHIHILQSDFDNSQADSASIATFPALESLTFTWLQPDTTNEPGSPVADDADPLSNLRRFVEATVVAPLCTFKYLRSTKAPEDALADAMADLGLDS